MKLDVDLSSLWASVRKMGAHDVDFNIASEVVSDFEVDEELSSTVGLDITLDDLDIDSGVLSVRGKQVLLFIPDHSGRVEEVLAGRDLGNRFHVADCKTLESMRRQKRFSRYKATYNVSGKFVIYGESFTTRKKMEGEATLSVCKNCLTYLNYQGYKVGVGSNKSKIFGEFDIAEFLSAFSTLFTSMPERLDSIDGGGYTDDWAGVSAKYRSSVEFVCESCRVDLSSHKRLLHSHHISGNKRDNRADNLRALCADCHRKQPKHDYMRISHADMQLLGQLRKGQSLHHTGSWKEIHEMADQALEGLLLSYEARNVALPEVGYELQGKDFSVVAELELAWPDRKRGVAIDAASKQAAELLGWKVLSVGEAVREMNK